MKQGNEPYPPRNLTFGDSALVALRGSQAVLENNHLDPFPQSNAARLLGNLLNKLPVWARIKIADTISLSIGRPQETFGETDPSKTAEWIISGYTKEKYPGLIIGAPGLAVDFLSGLTGFPYLPQPFLLNAQRNMKADDAKAYLEAGKELAEPLAKKYPDIETIVHYDPVHDRFLIKRLVFVRIKYLRLPDGYRRFIENRLEHNAPVILVDCRFKWPMAEISERTYFQLGGLGGISPYSYLNEDSKLIDYRMKWGGVKNASWKIDYEFKEGPESEWGSSGGFLDDAEQAASVSGCKPIRVSFDHPGDLSKSVFNLYRNCATESHHPEHVYIGVFTNTEPRFPLVTGALPIWLPFITEENIALVENILTDFKEPSKPSGTAFVTLHPSFCSPPDLVSLARWRSVLEKYFSDIEFLGTDPRKYPFDIGNYVRMFPAVIAAANRHAKIDPPFRAPSSEELERILCR